MPRPSYTTASQAFHDVYGDGSISHVATFLGGKVATNINSGIFQNACAIRMSYVMNQTGFPIRFGFGQIVTDEKKRRYLFRVRDLIRFLERTLGEPDARTSAGNVDQISGQRALLVFEVPFSDATGHATLWDGATCSDRCYFDGATNVLAWRLS